MELGGWDTVAQDEQVVVELVEAFAHPGVEHVVGAVVGMGGAIDVDEGQLALAEEGEFEELGGDLGSHRWLRQRHGGWRRGRGGWGSHRWLRQRRWGAFGEEGRKVVLESEVAEVALEEEVEGAIDAEAEDNALARGEGEGLEE